MELASVASWGLREGTRRNASIECTSASWKFNKTVNERHRLSCLKNYREEMNICKYLLQISGITLFWWWDQHFKLKNL